MEYVTIFTKGFKAYLKAVPLLVQRLKESGCEIIDNEVMFLKPEWCAIHYEKLVGGPFYKPTQRIFEDCPSQFFRVYGDVEVIKGIVGEETDSQKCSEGTIRYILGVGKGDNVLHRSADSLEAKGDDDRFWNPKTGFVAQFRRDPLARQEVERRLNELYNEAAWIVLEG